MKKTFATISLGVMVAVFGLLALPSASMASSWGVSLGVGINTGMMGGYGYGYGYPSYGGYYGGGCNWGCGSNMMYSPYQSYPMYQQPSYSYMNNYAYPVSNFSYNTYNPYYDVEPINYGRVCYRYC